jgi:hypothetical protein
LHESTYKHGGVAEWSIAVVLKTTEPQGSGGSNPSPTAIIYFATSAQALRMASVNWASKLVSSILNPVSGSMRLMWLREWGFEPLKLRATTFPLCKKAIGSRNE